MESSLDLPSILVFGPQSKLPSPALLSELRQILIRDPWLHDVRKAIDSLPQLWRDLVKFDPNLRRAPGLQSIEGLQTWIATGELPSYNNNSPNVLELPLTVTLQLTLYIRYLRNLGVKKPHQCVLECLKLGGIQGFCIGLLTAITLASSRNETDIAVLGARMIRLAVCIGAYVDCSGSFADPPSDFACFAIRGATEPVNDFLLAYKNAYISSTNDRNCVTVTCQAADENNMTETLRSRGFRTSTVHVWGRFHSSINSSALEQIMAFCSSRKEMKLPTVQEMQVPVRSSVDCQVIPSTSLLRVSLECILTEPANWYETMKNALLELPTHDRVVGLGSFGDCIPASISQSLHISNMGLLADGKRAPQPVRVGQPAKDINASDSTRRHHPISPMLDPPYTPNSIAIVGMAGRFAGADSLDELWELLLKGTSMVETPPLDRLKLPEGQAGSQWWGNFIRDSDAFDHQFFKKSSREAIAWDPQQRVLLEVAYQALESSGYFGVSRSNATDKDIGCYIGAVMNNYYDNVSCHPPTAYATVGTSRCFLSGAISHYFGWTGPALTIDTACSSSHVAIHTACKAILSGECSQAIAGGTNIITSPYDYQNLRAAGFLSPTGQCKPFDASADGYCRGEGVSVVVLKPMSSALRDNDNILGVILGSSANQNDNCSHITVPHSESQVNLYQKAMRFASVSKDDVSYIEAHGTGTGVGDPVECQSIRKAFAGPSRTEPLYISSIKGNIGHTEATAGIAGLVKVLLMIYHGKIPGQASFTTLNPNIPALEPDRMIIPKTTIPWTSFPRFACVNSYGAAGSNATVLVGQAPDTTSNDTRTRQGIVSELTTYPLVISAASKGSLLKYCENLLKLVRNVSAQREIQTSLSDLAFNLADRANHALPYVSASTVSSLSDLERKLTEVITASESMAIKKENIVKPIVLVFAGQDSKFIGLSQELFKSCKLLRLHLDDANRVIGELGFESLYPAIFQQSPLENLVTLHLALFSVQYATAKTWIDCGLDVSAVIGHSFGQLTAMCISGCLSLEDAIKLVGGRAVIMNTHWGSESGSMMRLRADHGKVSEILDAMKSVGDGHEIEIACFNGPENHVVVGTAESIDALEQFIVGNAALRDAVRINKLDVTHGFHSKLTDPLLPHLTALAREMEWKPAKMHLEICDDAWTSIPPDPRLLAEHTRRPVAFEQAVKRLTQKYPSCTWLEAGRGSSVMPLVRNCLSTIQDSGHLFLTPQITTAHAVSSLAEATVKLWRDGHTVQYWHFHRCQREEFQFLMLPPYQFEKSRHWLPFCDRNTALPSPSAEHGEVKPELLSMPTFKDASKTEAMFRIDPRNERYQSLLKGHVMGGQSLAPASLYFELVSRAAVSLQSDSCPKQYFPCVESLEMKSPLGLDTTRDILLCLTRLTSSQPAWSFTISTQLPQRSDGKLTQPCQHTTGLVSLHEQDDAKAAESFKRFETLIGPRRIEEIMNNPEAEKMQGNHIYRAFNTVVHYGEEFRGIRKVACVRSEAAGQVIMSVDSGRPFEQRLCDTPMTDSFMQFAGFLVNYFNNSSTEVVFVCMKIDRIQMASSFTPDAKEWIVYATMTEDDNHGATSDAYVFEAKSNKLVMTAFGFHFSKVSQSLLARMLKNVNTPVSGATQSQPKLSASETKQVDVMDSKKDVSKEEKSESYALRSALFDVLHEVTDVPRENITDESNLDELGIDSLMATEVLNDIRSVLGLSVDLATFLSFTSLHEVWSHLSKLAGVANETNVQATLHSRSPIRESLSNGLGLSLQGNLGESTPSPARTDTSSQFGPANEAPPASMDFAFEAFEKIQNEYDSVAVETGATKFWTQVYPEQTRLILKYVVEAFRALGCDLRTLRPGDVLPNIECLPQHGKLLRQLYNMLEGVDLISSTNNTFLRTDTPLDPTPSDAIYREIVEAFPKHANVHRLVQVIGSQLAACLRGDKDGLQLIFGDKANKQCLEDVYENWPLLRVPTLLLGDFLVDTFSKDPNGKFRILEVGAGTGGTTRYLVSHLRSRGISFEYTFTDLSVSLISSAKKHFQGVDGMSFEVLDIEQPPADKYIGAFDVIVATNCIHATRSLDQSLSHLHSMLREEGVVTLVEITRNMAWLDIVVGLFEGWWLFEDGRSHALVTETHWEKCMKRVGFSNVAWTDGKTQEAQTVRIIAGFRAALAPPLLSSNPTSLKMGMETVTYKEVGSTKIHADIYYPLESINSQKKLPIALMIHGGSHMIFSRKDIRPPQTRLLLEKGFIPVSLDHRLCPEMTLLEGPMVDVCDALAWAREKLPHIRLQGTKLDLDGERVVVVGWSSGGQLAMSLAWTAPQRGLRPPEAILAFYCPTDYEDEWWTKPIQPLGAEDSGEEYDLLEAVQDAPITNYGAVGAWHPLSDPRIQTDARCRIVLHINWKAQTLPVLVRGLPSKNKLSHADAKDWYNFPMPTQEEILPLSPLAQITRGSYTTPTFLIHGTEDDLIPWQQSQRTYDALVKEGVIAELELVPGAPHICDLSSDPEAAGWKAVLKGYEFITRFV